VRLLAILRSLWLSVRYARRLRIRHGEFSRYLRKSTNLALCYYGFSDSETMGQAEQAGRAAFLCCAYDVVTDWRGFDEEAFETFRQILTRNAPTELAALAISLYQKECAGDLKDDGLERGVIALEFVTRMMECRGHFRHGNYLRSAGRLLQLVDDLLDYEEDSCTGDLNCLASPRRREYLDQAEELASQTFLESLSFDPVLRYAIGLALAKARTLRSEDQQFLALTS